MFKLIGGAFVCGFALYGLVTYLDRTKSKAVIKPAMPDRQRVPTMPGQGM